MKTLDVIAPQGRICPMEGGKPAGVITDKKAVAVPNTAYYRRLLKEGSLLDPNAKKQAADAEPATAKKGGSK